MSRFTFFIGKGGVGKTTVSSAYALRRAAKNPKRRFLLISTDPAHSLSDILEISLSDRPKPLLSPRNLSIRQLDAGKQIQRFLSKERDDLLGVLNRGSLFTRDELEPLLDTTLPGMAEVAALLAIHDLLDSSFDEVIVDTAPMGHAIRLFQMPQHFSRLLHVLEVAASRDQVLATHFGGRIRREPALERWDHMVDRVTAALSPEVSHLILVTTPEPFSVTEAMRSASAFENAAPRNQISEVVLNRIVRNDAGCAECHRRSVQGEKARSQLRKKFPGAELRLAEDPGAPILGITALRAFGDHVFAGTPMSPRLVKRPPKTSEERLRRVTWPTLNTRLTLSIGKGGVGKTTVSAALAVNQRRLRRGESVTICSIDPAPSLDDVFAQNVGSEPRPVLTDNKLRAAELDANAEFQAVAAELRARIGGMLAGEQKGLHVDLSLDREFLLALLDVVPPGVDEIFAIFKILNLLASQDRVVIDMAPTGHAMEVLRTPARLLAWTRVLLKTLATHRTLPFAQDAAVELAKLSQNVREVMALLRDKRRCTMMVVTLAEPLPDYETQRLLKLLRELGAPMGAVFINRILTHNGNNCARCRRAAEWQRFSLARLKRQLRGIDVYVLHEFKGSLAGVKALKSFTRELWQFA